jgi:hypothetical protein
MAIRDLDRLAKHVRAHRLQQYSSRDAAAAAAGVTRNTWKRVEEGLSVRESTYAKIDKALGWAVGSCDLIASGDEPVLADADPATAAAPRMTDEEVRRKAFDLAAVRFPTAPVGEVREFADELVRVLRATGEGGDRE